MAHDPAPTVTANPEKRLSIFSAERTVASDRATHLSRNIVELSLIVFYGSIPVVGMQFSRFHENRTDGLYYFGTAAFSGGVLLALLYLVEFCLQLHGWRNLQSRMTMLEKE